MSGRRYAILFSGASNNRHVNDMEFLYRTLVDTYKFAENDIYVLNYNGTIDYVGRPHLVNNWPGDDTPYRMNVTGQGTKVGLDKVFDELRIKLTKDDLLLIHVTNHGFHDSNGPYILTYDENYYASDFARQIGELPQLSCLMIMMEQCYAGGFIKPIMSRSKAEAVSVATSSDAASRSVGNEHFDPFARDWIAAMRGADPYGAPLVFNPDIDGDGMVSAQEAFNYADTIKDPHDSPMFGYSGGGNKSRL